MAPTDIEARPIRIYLIAPDGAADAPGHALKAAAEAGDIAALLIPAPIANAPALIAAAQKADIAVIAVDGVPVDGVDGVHVDGDFSRFAVLRRTMADAIVGIGGLARRDDGMTVAEAGADYVAFGRLASGDAPLPLDTREGLLSWWQAVMTVPCVARAETEDEALALAEAGADFVALAPDLWTGPDGADRVARLTVQFAEIGARTAEPGAMLERVP